MGDVQKALTADKVPAPLMKLLQAEAKAEAKPKAKPKAAKAKKPKAAKPKADPRDAKIAKFQAQLDALQTLLNDM